MWNSIVSVPDHCLFINIFTLELPALIAEKTIRDLLGMLDSNERLLTFGRRVD